jgi:hypothetical protein
MSSLCSGSTLYRVDLLSGRPLTESGINLTWTLLEGEVLSPKRVLRHLGDWHIGLSVWNFMAYLVQIKVFWKFQAVNITSYQSGPEILLILWVYLMSSLCSGSTSYRVDLLSGRPLVGSTFCQVDLLSGQPFVRSTFCQVDLMSGWPYIGLILCQVDLMSGWPYVGLT